MTVLEGQALLLLLPTEDEEQTVRGFNGPLESLGTAEKFVAAIAKVPGVCKPMARAMLTSATFETEARKLVEAMDVAEQAAKEVRESATLQEVLLTALELGNYLNGGSRRGGE